MVQVANLIGRTYRRRVYGFAVSGFALIAGLALAAAADWLERPFAPKIGSRWTIETEETTERQTTGLKIGETRTDTLTRPFPGGGQIQENRSLTIAHADTASGNVTFILTTTGEPGSLRTALIGMMEQLGETNPEAKRQAEALKELQISQESRTEIDVVGGMARQLRVETTTAESLHGNSTLTVVHKTVSVIAAK